jgi:O-methyltransferase involved in polyketide biosynthesis
VPVAETPGSRGLYGFDARVAHPARVYDYWLGGKDNFEADRIAGEETIAAYPAIRASARANRAFLARTVSYLAADAGIRQFLDLGTGLPTASNTHEVAQSVAPESRVVYVDNDPLVLSHARALLTSSPEGVTAYLDADLRDTDHILEQAAGTLDFGRPVAIMLLAILHYIPDLAEARRIVARLVDAVPSGSYLAISHAASDISPEAMAEMIRRMNEHLAEGNHVGRTRELLRRPGPARPGRRQGHRVAPGVGGRGRGPDQPVGRRRPQAIAHWPGPVSAPGRWWLTVAKTS